MQFDSAVLFLSNYPKNMKLLSQRLICTAIFFAALSTTVMTWKLKGSTNEWMGKNHGIYNGIGNSFICDNMNGS